VLYRRSDRDPTRGALNFCGHCGSTVGWLPDEHDGGAIAIINMRLFDPAVLDGIPVEFPDGAKWSGHGPFDFRAPATRHAGISH
jgi:hypothetical protein